MFLPRRITISRKQLKLSQEKFLVFLANEGLQISRPTLASWESGTTYPTAKELAVISLATNRPVAYFFDLKHSHAGYARNRAATGLPGKKKG